MLLVPICSIFLFVLLVGGCPFTDGTATLGPELDCQLVYAILKDVLAFKATMTAAAWTALPWDIDLKTLDVDYAGQDEGQAGREAQQQLREIAASAHPSEVALAFVAKEKAQNAAERATMAGYHTEVQMGDPSPAAAASVAKQTKGRANGLANCHATHARYRAEFKMGNPSPAAAAFVARAAAASNKRKADAHAKSQGTYDIAHVQTIKKKPKL